jgi:hypothetical protein
MNRQAVVSAIHFGDSEADAVTRLHVERLGFGAAVLGIVVSVSYWFY